MMTDVSKKIEEIEWEPHFMTDNGSLRWIYTRERDDAPMSVVEVLLRKGVTLPDHVHQDQPDLIYVLAGKATMFIQGEEEFPLGPGKVVMVPPNTLHAIRNVEEDLYVYNVFTPPIK